MLKTKTELLTAQEKKICEELTRIEAGQSSLRAAALLAVNKGATHAQASEQTGLTPGQVTYAVASFRKRKIALFLVDIVAHASSPRATGQVEGGADTGEGQKEAVGGITASSKNTKIKKEKKAKKKVKAKADKKALKAKEKKAAKKKEKKAKKKVKLEKKTKKDKSTRKQKRKKRKDN